MQILVKLSELKSNVPKPDGAGVPIEEARGTLGITYPVIRALIDEGHLTTSTVMTHLKNRKQEFIDPVKLEEFRRDYISATEVAAAQSTHVRTLVPRLRAIGIKPAIEKSEVGQYFYLRSDIESG